MALDGDAARVLEMVRLSGRPPYETLTPPEARALFRAAREVLAPDPQPVAETRDLAAPGAAGRVIPLRLYRGAISAPGGQLPGLVYFHGGGWVIGDLDTHDSVCRNSPMRPIHRRLGRLPARARAQIPGRRRGLLRRDRWVADEADALGIDRERLAVGGDSAGGNLAAVVACWRATGGRRIARQALLYPALDCAMTHPSHDRFAEGFLLTRATMQWFYDQYLQGPQDVADWRASPLRAADLSGVAPALVLTAGNDVLSDEGEAYARRLREHGVPVELADSPTRSTVF